MDVSIMRDAVADKSTTVSASHPCPCVVTEACAAPEAPEAPVEVEVHLLDPTMTNLDAITTTKSVAQAGETTTTKSLPSSRDKIVVDTVAAAVVGTSVVACVAVLSATKDQTDPNALIWDPLLVEDEEDVETTMVTQDRAETISMFPSAASTSKMTSVASNATVGTVLPPTATTTATAQNPAIAAECAAAAEATTVAVTETMATRETSVERHFPTTTANHEVAVETTTVQALAVEAITMAQAEAVVVEVTTTAPTEVAAATSKTACEEATVVACAEVEVATIATSTTTMTSHVNTVQIVAIPTARGKIISKEDTTTAPVETTAATLATTTTMTAIMETSPCTEVVAEACAAVEAATSMAPTEEATPTGEIGHATETTTTRMPRSKSLKDPAPIAEAEVTCSCEEAEVAVAENLEVLAAVVTSAEAEETSEEEEISEATIREVVPIWVVEEATEIKWSTTTKNEPSRKEGSSRRDKRDEAASIRKSDDALKRKKIGLGRPQGPCLG